MVTTSPTTDARPNQSHNSYCSHTLHADCANAVAFSVLIQNSGVPVNAATSACAPTSCLATSSTLQCLILVDFVERLGIGGGDAAVSPIGTLRGLPRPRRGESAGVSDATAVKGAVEVVVVVEVRFSIGYAPTTAAAEGHRARVVGWGYRLFRPRGYQIFPLRGRGYR